jgi:hypothetical protein
MEGNCPVYRGMFRIEAESGENSARTKLDPSGTESQVRWIQKRGKM